ncbi:MAG: cell wall hydrolase [Eubacteriales bacterium]|nr:cell wall hydrolase [Eubacteriales bacterium]
MTRNKRKNSTGAGLCILAALVFGMYLGSPIPKVWAHPVSEVMSVVSEQITKIEHLHSTITEDKTDAEKNNDITDIKDKGDLDSTTTFTENNKNLSTIEESGVAAAAPEAVEKGPDSILGMEAEASITATIPQAQEDAQSDYNRMNASRGGSADRNEIDTLVHLINAEAYGLSYKAKVAVGKVVMNRWTGPYYGNNLLAIMTAPHQFTPIYNGSAFKKEVEPDSVKAAYAVLSGSGVDGLTDDTYYFVNPDYTQDKTIERNMEFVCEIEGLHFFRPPSR